MIVVAAINKSASADWNYYQEYSLTQPPGQFNPSQLGTDANGNPYTMVWPANCNPDDVTRPMYPVAIGTRNYAIYQTTEPPLWTQDETPTSIYCGVATNSDAPASAGDAQTLANNDASKAAENQPNSGIRLLEGLHQCNEN